MEGRLWTVKDARTGEELAKSTHPYSAELLAKKLAAERGRRLLVVWPGGDVSVEVGPGEERGEAWTAA